jgi:hypothetical protein
MQFYRLPFLSAGIKICPTPACTLPVKRVERVEACCSCCRKRWVGGQRMWSTIVPGARAGGRGLELNRPFPFEYLATESSLQL